MQNLAVAQNVPFTVGAGQVQVVTVPAWCLNQSYKPPAGTPMRITSFTVTPFSSQDEAWADMGRRR